MPALDHKVIAQNVQYAIESDFTLASSRGYVDMQDPLEDSYGIAVLSHFAPAHATYVLPHTAVITRDDFKQLSNAMLETARTLSQNPELQKGLFYVHLHGHYYLAEASKDVDSGHISFTIHDVRTPTIKNQAAREEITRLFKKAALEGGRELSHKKPSDRRRSDEIALNAFTEVLGNSNVLKTGGYWSGANCLDECAAKGLELMGVPRDNPILKAGHNSVQRRESFLIEAGMKKEDLVVVPAADGARFLNKNHKNYQENFNEAKAHQEELDAKIAAEYAKLLEKGNGENDELFEVAKRTVLSRSLGDEELDAKFAAQVAQREATLQPPPPYVESDEEKEKRFGI